MPTEPSFSRAEVFPLIARLILASHGDEAGFVAHAAIVAGLLADGERADVVVRVRAESSFPDERACASNRVQWFSQQITVGKSPWSDPLRGPRVSPSS